MEVFRRWRARVGRASRTSACVAGLAVWTAASGCASARFVPPTAAPVARADGRAVWAEATRACAGAQAFAGDVRASGRVAGQRVSGLRLAMALGRPGRAALEARVSSTLLFALRGTEADATLVLFQDRRVVNASAGDLMDALIGVPLGPERLMAVLTGCVSFAEPEDAQGVGEFVRVRTQDATVYVRAVSGGWRARAGAFDGLTVDYQYDGGDFPSRVRLTSDPGRSPAIDLALTLASFDTNPRDPAVFLPRVPVGFDRGSLDWVRENGPLQR